MYVLERGIQLLSILTTESGEAWRGGRPSKKTLFITLYLPVCGGAAGSCTVTQSPPAARRVTVSKGIT